MKKLKFVLAVLMIISIVIPSFATPIGIDPSMYVPKEEFYSIFADFNNRLSAFEGGINAKIDQQVSSYLDRYGIWNGEKQQIIESGNFVYIGEEDFNNRYICYHNPPECPPAGQRESIFKTNILESGEFMIPTKSDLLCMDVDTKSGYSTSSHTWSVDNRRTFWYQMEYNYPINTVSKGFYYAMELYDYNTNDLKMAIDIGEPYNIGNTTGSWKPSGFMVIYKNFSGLYQCFVEKDKKINWRTIFKYNVDGDSTSYFSFSYQMRNEWNMRFKSAIVY